MIDAILSINSLNWLSADGLAAGACRYSGLFPAILRFDAVSTEYKVYKGYVRG
ncbi:Hypothetical protein BIBO2_0015 [Brucella sp. BO2]|nr:Hypothetical protein BIBO2_0015 [Brucella sp. BO2]